MAECWTCPRCAYPNPNGDGDCRICMTSKPDIVALDISQPLPAANEEPPVWPLVIQDVAVLPDSAGSKALLVADMLARHEHGLREYGVPLQPHNGRDALKDVYAEVLDSCAYAKQMCLESPESKWAESVYLDLLECAAKMRAALAQRDRE